MIDLTTLTDGQLDYQADCADLHNDTAYLLAVLAEIDRRAAQKEAGR